MEIEIDFEGRNPIDSDYHGIKTLLQQLFLKNHIDLKNLTDLIISQNYVGSVVKQSDDGQIDDDDDDDDINDVFGITTVINISDNKDVLSVQQLRDLLLELANEHASDEINKTIINLLKSESTTLGLLINERFVNIPVQISVPLFDILITEMKRAASKNMPFEFTHFILICKLHKPNENSKNKSKSKKIDQVIWSNPEEEIFAEMASMSFEFCVENESDSGLTGKWSEDDDELTPYRRVLIFEASKLQTILDSVKSQVHLPPNSVK